MSRAVHLEVKLPDHVRPSEESTDQLIKKFIKACSKESLVQYLYDNCAWNRRFVKKSVKEREKRQRYKRNAQKHNKDLMSEVEEKTKKKKKTINKNINNRQ